MTASRTTDRVDWLAVEFVCNGTPMRLGDDGATLETAILRMGYGLTVAQMSERLGTNPTRIIRVLKKAGAKPCPFCHRHMLCDGFVLPVHVKPDGIRCRMSGHRYDDRERATSIRSDQRAVKRLG